MQVEPLVGNAGALKRVYGYRKVRKKEKKTYQNIVFWRIEGFHLKQQMTEGWRMEDHEPSQIIK